MAEIFIEKSVAIDATAARVWSVLTDPVISKFWIMEWWPNFGTLESDWKRGSSATWRLADGTIGATGTVTVFEPNRRLAFSFNVNDPGTSRQEIVTFSLQEQGGRTLLSVSAGDFGDSPEHEACYLGVVESWNKALPRIKRLAEGYLF